LRADDPKLGITWPRPITMRSHRDAGLPTADELLVRMQ
jgi:dTDP-4-dehydrorhamnose 3,5-epimerase-like enzyme